MLILERTVHFKHILDLFEFAFLLLDELGLGGAALEILEQPPRHVEDLLQLLGLLQLDVLILEAVVFAKYVEEHRMLHFQLHFLLRSAIAVSDDGHDAPQLHPENKEKKGELRSITSHVSDLSRKSSALARPGTPGPRAASRTDAVILDVEVKHAAKKVAKPL